MKQIVIAFAVFLVSLAMPTAAQEGWKFIGPDRSEILSLAVQGDVIFCTIRDGGLHRSTDAGATWTQLDTLLFPRGAYGLQFLPDIIPIIAATVSRNDGRFLVSVDLGETWIRDGKMPLTPMERFWGVRDSSGLVLAIASTGGSPAVFDELYRSTDFGVTWSRIGNFPTGSSHGLRLSLGFSSTSPVIYAMYDDSMILPELFRSTDAGITWNYVRNNVYGRYLHVDIDNPDVIFLLNGGIYQSDDAGVTWRQISLRVTLSAITMRQDPINTNHLYVQTYGGGRVQVQSSSDRGASWQVDSASLLLPPVQGYFREDQQELFHYDHIGRRLYIGTSQGLFVREHLVSSIAAPPSASGPEITVYPQPAHASLTMKFVGFPESNCLLTAHNVLGERVRSWQIHNGDGVNWDLRDHSGASVPNGLYLLTAVSSSKIVTRRVLVQR